MQPVRGEAQAAGPRRGQGQGCVDNVERQLSWSKANVMVDSEMKVTGVLGKRRLLDPGAEGTERRQAFAAEGSGGEGGWGRDDQRRLDPLGPDLRGVSAACSLGLQIC